VNAPVAPASARFRLDWYAGSSALFDLAGVLDQPGKYSLRYGSPFRSTMRAPATQLPVGDNEFRPLIDELRDFAGLPTAVARGRTAPPGGALKPGEVVERLSMIGQSLAKFVIPQYTLRDLEREEVFIEIGTDEGLVALPWELLHDGQTFLSLRNPMGRYVNLNRVTQNQSAGSPASDPGALRVLIVSVPRPLDRGGRQFEELPGAEAEGKAVLETMLGLGITPHFLAGRDATFTEVRKALFNTKYHIIHFTGHASFNAKSPSDSALILHDGPIGLGALTSYIGGQTGCVLSFINACETAQPGQVAANAAPAPGGGIDWDREYDIFGLARSFLESGSYLLGTRWLLPDKPAVTFATTFYKVLLGSGEPIGTAIRDARRACFAEYEDDGSWASYIYYGDPRVYFRRVEEPAAGGASPPTPEGPQPAESAAAALPASPAALDSQPGPEKIKPPEPGEPPLASPPAADPSGPWGAAGGSPNVDGQGSAAPTPPRPTLDLKDLREYGRRYEDIRETQSAGTARTAAMSGIVYEVADLVSTGEPGDAPRILLDGPPGDRIVAMALLQVRPDPTLLPPIMDAIQRLRTPFEQYQALTTALAMVPVLSADQADELQHLLRKKLPEPDFFGTDRSLVARSVLAALGHPELPGDQSGVGNPVFA
jgi:CHAT domain-containing protein